jgi:hypothetical protein
MGALHVELTQDRGVLPLAAIMLQPEHSPPFPLTPR